VIISETIFCKPKAVLIDCNTCNNNSVVNIMKCNFTNVNGMIKSCYTFPANPTELKFWSHLQKEKTPPLNIIINCTKETSLMLTALTDY